MKRIGTIYLVLAASLFSRSHAQEFDSIASKYALEIKAQSLRSHLEILASDEYEGRETGKKGQKMAMNYLIEEFKKYGISDYDGLNYTQSFPLIEQESGGIVLKIEDQELKILEDFSLKPSFIAKQRLEGTLTFYNEGNVDSTSNIFLWKEDTASNYLSSIKSQVELLVKSDARSIFYYDDRLSNSLKKYKTYYERSTTRLAADLKDKPQLSIVLSDSGLEKVLLAAGIKKKKLDKKGRNVLSELSLDFQLDIDKPSNNMTSENVIAYIPGSDKKDELIVITAHYDHLGKRDSLIYNGADDDGTGTVSLLEIAQSFKFAEKDGFRPRRSILIMPVSGEEKGLLGSKYYSENPVFPLEQTVVDLNIDMIGRYDENHKEDSNYIYLIGADKLSSELHDISEKVNDLYTDFNLDYTYNDENDPNRFYYRSDHYNFAKNNIPVIFYFSGVHEDYHRPTDTPEKIDYEKTARVARLVFLTAWELANRDERLKLNEELGDKN